jgi:hypothetical protein
MPYSKSRLIINNIDVLILYIHYNTYYVIVINITHYWNFYQGYAISMIVMYLTSISMLIYLIIVSILEITQGKMKINFVY